MERMNSLLEGGSSGAENFSQLMPAADGGAVSPILMDSYEVVYGAWPQGYDEVIFVLDEHNQIPVNSLYQLGLHHRTHYKANPSRYHFLIKAIYHIDNQKFILFLFRYYKHFINQLFPQSSMFHKCWQKNVAYLNLMILAIDK